MTRLSPRLATVGLFCLLPSLPADAITIRHDQPDSLYIDEGLSFPAVGELNINASFFCTGTLVSSTQVLTAAHCADFDEDNVSDITAGTFKVGAETVSLGAAAVNTWGGDFSLDLAVITLTAPITTVSPMAISIQSALGQAGTIVGIGMTGDGNTGQSTLDLVKRAAENQIDAIDTTAGAEGVYVYDFDDLGTLNNVVGSTFPLSLEGMIAAGDGGGPLVADFGAGDVIVGVNVFTVVTGPVISGYGTLAGAVDLSATPNKSFLQGQGLTLVPEPSTALLFAAGLMGLGLRGRQRSASRWSRPRR